MNSVFDDTRDQIPFFAFICEANLTISLKTGKVYSVWAMRYKIALVTVMAGKINGTTWIQ
jgi:hypothetical protein